MTAAVGVSDSLKRAAAGVPGVAPAFRWMKQRKVRAAALARGVTVSFHADRIRLVRDGTAIVLAPAHLVYVPTIAHHFATFFGAVDSADVNGVATVDFSQPRLHRYTGSGLEFWLASFAEEPEAIDAYRHRNAPGAGDVVFDLGAYCGVSTYHFSRWVGPTGRVVALEPDPQSFALLQRNIALHQLPNVTAVQGAVAAESGVRSFNVDGTLGAAFADVIPRGVFQRTREVRAMTLSELSARAGVTPTHVKMDIEGAEIEVLESSAEFLRAHRCALVIDSSHKVAGQRTVHAVERALSAAGYEFESNEMYGLMNTWAWPSSR